MSSRHGDGLRTYRNRLSNMILLRSKSLRSSVNSTRGSVNISNLDPRLSTESITSDSTHLCSPAGSTTALSSSSHTTPLLSSVHMNAVDQSPWNDPVPPTTNDLDAKEKARLLKKARKLSKVFGDVLTIEPPSPTLSHNRRASEPHTSRRPASAGGGGPSRHRRGHHSQHDSMAGNLTLPQITEVISFKDRPGSRTRTRHAVKASLSLGGTLYPAASSTPSLYSPSLKSSVDGDDQSSVISATPTIPTRLSPERARRATMAKLTRHLGENIPPQLIPHIVDRTPEVEPDRPWLRKKRRRRSLDSISLGSRLFTVPEGMADVTRSRSFSNKSKGKDPAYRSSVDFHHHYGLSFEANRSGDQRLNVKRARKMVKLFGEEPPADLIQYHSGGTSEGAREDTTSHDISIPPTPELSASPSLKSRPMSPSTIDSVSSPSDAFHPTRDPSDQLEPVIAVNPDDLEPPLTPITPTSPKPGGPSGFSDRRRRAAKLSRFFGVGYQDISSVPELLPSIFPKTEPPAPPAVQVDVKKTGRRIWGFSDGGSINMRDVDMLDVIDKLRDLKAA